MEIRYKCKRCKKIVNAIVYQTNFKNGKSDKDHNRVDCGECGRYIKFIGNRELSDIYPGWEHEIIKKRTPIDRKYQQASISDHSSVDLSKIIENQKEIKFLLDVIIDHLQIRYDFVSDYKLKVV